MDINVEVIHFPYVQVNHPYKIMIMIMNFCSALLHMDMFKDALHQFSYNRIIN